MSEVKIKETNLVKVLAAQARNESVDSALANEANEFIQTLAQDLTPNNKHTIAEVVAYGVNEIIQPKLNWLDLIADVKRVPEGTKAQFSVELEGIRAFIQAKGSTTPRSKIAHKTFTLDTINVSARPAINIVELRTGQTNMAALIQQAAYQMELKENQEIQRVLNAAMGTAPWTSPYYAAGSGIVKATFDPMLKHFSRLSGGANPAIVGDIDMIDKLVDLTGFNQNTTTKQFAESIMDEVNNTGYIGKYRGCVVGKLINPMIDGTDDLVLDTKKLFILPVGISNEMRPLKVIFEGDVVSMEDTNINDRQFEVVLDQAFGVGFAVGVRPYMGVYEDTSL